jgi:hypothetical protein
MATKEVPSSTNAPVPTAQEPVSVARRAVDLLAFVLLALLGAKSKEQAKPQPLSTPDERPPVSVTTRVASFLAFAIFVVFGALAKKRASELGLAFVTGGALFATPQLVEALIVSPRGKQTSAFRTHLRTVAVLGAIGLGIVIFTGSHRGISTWKLVVLFVAGLLEVEMALGVVPFWLGRSVSILFGWKKLKGWLDKLTAIPRRFIAAVEKDGGFFVLGAVLFLVGTIIQFIAGA